MLKKGFIFFLISSLCGNALKAQFLPSSHIGEDNGGFQGTNGTVGVPLSFQFEPQNPGFGPGVPYTCTFARVPNDPLPPGLTLSSSGLLSGTPTQAGSYNFGIDITYNFTGGSITLGILGGAIIAANTNPLFVISPSALNFSFIEGSTSPITQSLVIASNFHLDVDFGIGFDPNWLKVSWPGKTDPCLPSPCELPRLPAFSTAAASVTVDPSSLHSGTYSGTVFLSFNVIYEIPVLVTVSSAQPQLRLSQSGLFFKTVAGGASPASQSVTVLDTGASSLDFTVSTLITSGGSKWLSASPGMGTTTSSTPASVAVNIDPTGLPAGDYYGVAQFSPKDNSNSPVDVTVVLHVDKAGTDVGASLSQTGLIFVGQAGGADPAAQSISITNPSPFTLTFSAATFFDTGNNWFTVTPSTGSVNATTPAQISVQPTISALPSGVYRGDLVLQFAEDASARHVAVLLIVTPTASARTSHAVAAASTCTPTMLLPVFTQLGADFSVSVAWPTSIEVTVVDDCGTFLTAGSVTASFSDGDPSLPLTSLEDGRWSATWQPGGSSAQVVITVQATELSPALQGTQEIGGALQANPTTPAVNAVVSAAHYAAGQPIAPGAFISIYGVHLSSGPNSASSLPLDTQLGSTLVVLGGRPLPLQYAGDGQVNAIIPYDVPANSTQQLIVSNGPALSVPHSVAIAPTQPAVFAQNDGYGVVFDVKPNSSTQVLVDAEHPISAGDALVIYCSGLGAVDPPGNAGTAAPASPPAATTNTVSVTIGGDFNIIGLPTSPGKSAKVFFSGLVGGFAGLYQVNAYVPSGITPGDSVPLVVSVAGLNSAPVNVAVK